MRSLWSGYSYLSEPLWILLNKQQNDQPFRKTLREGFFFFFLETESTRDQLNVHVTHTKYDKSTALIGDW